MVGCRLKEIGEGTAGVGSQQFRHTKVPRVRPEYAHTARDSSYHGSPRTLMRWGMEVRHD